MCGIIGIRDDKLSKDHFRKAVDQLIHRGPDHQDVRVFDREGVHYLGHTRLSIIDLSSVANQPMASRSGKCTIIYNGEIYNFKDIRQQLQSESGISFRTASDTELLVEAFEFWGPEFVEKLNGMFAFGIFEHSSGRHFLFRDRVGIKPLYFMEAEGKFVYASELKAIKSIYPDLTTDRFGIYQFLHLGYIPHPYSIYSEVRKFPAGCYGIYDSGGLAIHPYWKAKTYFEAEPIRVKNPVQDVRHLLEASVKERLLSDVPVGTFLSGGSDSSLITAMANNIYGSALPAFHVKFENTVHDESLFARQVAEYSGAEYHEIFVSEHESLSQMWDILDAFDEPFNDQSSIPTHFISAKASEHVKVCLSGDGGDELFLGYGMYNWARRLKGISPAIFPLIKSILQQLPGERNRRASWLFGNDSGNTASHIFSQEQYLFSQHELKEDLSFFNEFEFTRYNTKRSAAENQAYFDFLYYLPDDLLTKVDRSSMQNSLEVRVPLLDHRIVEYMLALHSSHKWRKGDMKFLLKSVISEYLPKGTVNNKKWGFSPPTVRWLRTEFSTEVEKYLSEKVVNNIGLVNSDYVKELLFRYYHKGEDRWYNKIWALMILHRWLDKNQ